MAATAERHGAQAHQVPECRQGLPAVHDGSEQYEPWLTGCLGYWAHPLKAYDEQRCGRAIPRSRSTGTRWRAVLDRLQGPDFAATGTVQAEYIMVQMFASVAPAATPEAAVEEAERRTKRYYRRRVSSLMSGSTVIASEAIANRSGHKEKRIASSLRPRNDGGQLHDRNATTIGPVPSRQPGWLARLFDYKPFLIVDVPAPALGLLLVFLTYPLGLGIWLAFTDTTIGRRGMFVGLENFQYLLADPCSGAPCSTACSTRRRHHREVRARPVAGAAAQQPSPVQEPVARHHPAALDRADGAVGDRVLVDLRSAVLDHLLPAGRRAAHPHHLYRLPRHPLAARAGR